MRHLELIADGLIAAVKSHVGAAIGPLLARLNELDAALKAVPAGTQGEPGPKGDPADVDYDRIGSAIKEVVAVAVAELPVPQNGKDADPVALQAEVQKSFAALVDDFVQELERAA